MIMTDYTADGYLRQVLCAEEAVARCCLIVGVCGTDCVVLGMARHSAPALNLSNPLPKICSLSRDIAIAITGVNCDYPVVLEPAQAECQKYEEQNLPVSLKYMAKYIAMKKQGYTQSSIRGPLAISCLIGGFKNNGTSCLYHTEPSGNYNEWRACALGRRSRTVREFLKREYKANVASTQNDVIRLALRALLAGGNQPGQQYLEVGVLEYQSSQSIKALDQKVMLEHIAELKIETPMN